MLLHPGDPPTGLTLSHFGVGRMTITWTDPDIRPRGGYRIEVTGSTNSTLNSASSPELISLSSPGIQVVTLVSLSRHYPISNLVENITFIREALSNQLICYCCCRSCYIVLLAPTSPSMSSLTATSVTISWTQPVGGPTVDIYRVNLTRSSTGMCPGVRHVREETTSSTSIVIYGLEENSIYTVTISAVNNEFNAVNTSELTITTLAAGMLLCGTHD